MSLRPIDGETPWHFCMSKLLINVYKYYIFENQFFMERYQGVSPSIGHRDMYYSLLDSSRQGASNDGRFMSLASLDEKLFVFYCFSFFKNNLIPIDSRNMWRPPFDAPRHGDSNELFYMIFWSQVGEIVRFKCLKKKLPGDFW